MLAGIAAADAACCARLGFVSRGQDHSQAVALVATVRPDGDKLAKDLERLLVIKDKVQYQAIMVSLPEAKAAVNQSKRMIAIVDVLLA